MKTSPAVTGCEALVLVARWAAEQAGASCLPRGAPLRSGALSWGRNDPAFLVADAQERSF